MLIGISCINFPYWRSGKILKCIELCFYIIMFFNKYEFQKKI